ncbi:MAG: hypothetical protein AB8B85_11420, partial [Paracoccaceae bacterium]
MTELKTTVVGGETKRSTVSDEIAGAVRTANERIDRMDTDPIIRLALARVAIRAFAQEVSASYPDQQLELATEFEAMADALRGAEDLPAAIKRVLETEDDPAAEAGTGGLK